MTDVYLGRYDKWPKPLSRYSSAKARGSRGGKRHTYDFYYDDNGTLYTKKVKGLAKILPKQQVFQRKKYICLTCGRPSIQLVKSNEDFINCPFCTDSND